ncbi:hypothetical protein HMPREF1572_00611 [Gardnerella vaginalis JCP7275]|nr:hypothetical protein HMPREF1572_00611 [Gardnerella vaginalis JCP7275]
MSDLNTKPEYKSLLKLAKCCKSAGYFVVFDSSFYILVFVLFG